MTAEFLIAVIGIWAASLLLAGAALITLRSAVRRWSL